MPSTILTELAKDVLKWSHLALEEQRPGYYDRQIKITTANAAEQLNQAQRERVEKLKDAMLTPGQLEGLADFILRYGDLDKDSHCLSSLILRNKAEETRAALAELEVEDVRASKIQV